MRVILREYTAKRPFDHLLLSGLSIVSVGWTLG